MNFSLVSDQEELSRFLFDNQDFTESSGNIRWNRLMPVFCEQLDRLETSIFRTSTLKQDKEIWESGDAFAGLKRKPPKAIAVLQAEQIRNKQKLDVIPETSSHPLHAVIVNWPEAKDGQIEICKELKKAVELRVR